MNAVKVKYGTAGRLSITVKGMDNKNKDEIFYFHYPEIHKVMTDLQQSPEFSRLFHSGV